MSCVLDVSSVVESRSTTTWGSTHTPFPPSASLATAVKNRSVIQPYPRVTHPLTPAFKEMRNPLLQKLENPREGAGGVVRMEPRLKSPSEGLGEWSEVVPPTRLPQ